MHCVCNHAFGRVCPAWHSHLFSLVQLSSLSKGRRPLPRWGRNLCCMTEARTQVRVVQAQQVTQVNPPRKCWRTDSLKKHVLSAASLQFSSVTQLYLTLCNPMNHSNLSITNSQSSPKLVSIKQVMPSSHLILCRPLLLLPPIPPSIRVFSNESVLCIRRPK